MGHAGVMKKMIEGWFSEALRYIANIPGGMEALSDPRHVFNIDESGFAMDAGTGHIKTVMVPCGAQQVCKWARGTKEQVTVNAACNAAGDYMFPFLLFPGKIMTQYIRFQDFLKVLYGCSENGWMMTKN